MESYRIYFIFKVKGIAVFIFIIKGYLPTFLKGLLLTKISPELKVTLNINITTLTSDLLGDGALYPTI